MSDVREYVSLALVRAAVRWGIDPTGLGEAEIETVLAGRIARAREIVTPEDVAAMERGAA